MPWEACHGSDPGKNGGLLLRCGAGGGAGQKDRRRGRLRHAGQHHPQRGGGTGAGGAGRADGGGCVPNTAGGNGGHPFSRRTGGDVPGSGGKGRAHRGCHLSQCGADTPAGGQGGGGGADAPHYRRGPPSGGAGSRQPVAPFRDFGRAGGAGKVAGGEAGAAGNAFAGCRADHVHPNDMAKCSENSKKRVYKRRNL